MNFSGIILAAGASQRMGSPKALLHFSGETFLDRLIGIFSDVCSEVIVVLGLEADRVRSSSSRSANFVVNSNPERGQLSSLQCGLRSVSHPVDAVLFTPVDFPAIQPATVKKMTDVFTPGDAAVIPRFNGKHGHPVLLAGVLSFDLLALGEGAAARDVVHAYSADTRYVDVEDGGILRDVDDPAAYAALLEVRLSD